MQHATDNKYVLVVDDDPTMQLVLQGMIEKAGFQPVIAENAEKALQLIELGGDNMELILLDRHMPDMDGLEMVEKLHAIKIGHDIPVIMQSGAKKPKEIKEAIDAGIFYYLSKPFKMEALQTVLNFGIEQSELQTILEERTDQGYAPVNLIRSASFEYNTAEDATKMALLLSTLFPDPNRTFPGMQALLMNAVEHGTLGLGYADKSAHITVNTYNEEIATRAKTKDNKDKLIELQFIHTDGRFSVRITDTGTGFDWKKWIAFDTEPDNATNGYGIIKALKSFDEIKYNTVGNQVMASTFETKK